MSALDGRDADSFERVCEANDVRRAIEKLSNLGRYCLVSYLGRESKRLDPYFERMPSAVIRRFEVGNGVMNRPVNIVIWKPS